MMRSILTTVALVTAYTPSAWACGGFFCSRAAPVDQAGELLFFDVEGRDLTMHVQIKYSGPSEQFAWILPIPADHPDNPVAVSTEILFNALLGATNPRLSVQQEVEGECLPGPQGCYDWGDMSTEEGEAGPPSAGGGDDESGVEVHMEDQVGPYDVVVISAGEVDVLLTWLAENGYDIPEATGPLLEPYIGDAHFVAMKLTKGAEAGDIQPVALSFRADEASIPLRLTAVAAMADMPIFAWFLGEGRAVPIGFKHIVVNELQLPWSPWGVEGGTNTWRTLIGAAADEAGGRAFATEFAGRSSQVRNRLPNPGRFDVEALLSIETPAPFVRALLRQGFPRDTRMQNLLRRFIPMPAALAEQGVDERSFYNRMDRYEEEIQASGFVFDVDGFVAALEEEIIGPLTVLYERFSTRPDLTALYTQLSPDEMTEDPRFAMNPDLPDVENLHRITRVTECQAEVLFENAIYRLQRDDGLIFHVAMGTAENSYAPDDSLPSALRIETMDVEGEATVDVDNDPAIRERAEAGSTAARAALGDPLRTDPESVSCENICCVEHDECGWSWNRRCDCGGQFAWDQTANECGERNCEPGAETPCGCADGSVGIQRCGDDGARFGVCDCQDTTVEPDPRENVCPAGRIVACSCPDGREGAQRCADDGAALGVCACDEPDTGPEDQPMATCVPGRSVPCQCDTDTDGAAICRDDGSGFGVCQCGELGAAVQNDDEERTEQVGCAGGCAIPAAAPHPALKLLLRR